MKKKVNYPQKLEDFKNNTLYPFLDEEQRVFLQDIALQFRFTFQEFRQLAEACRDLQMWGEQSLHDWWARNSLNNVENLIEKNNFLKAFRTYFDDIKSAAKEYPKEQIKKLPRHKSGKIVLNTSDRTVFGECPVQSPKTICCNLKTIDAVESCIFGCSYCTIQTFYHDQITIEGDLANKLKTLQLDPDRNYHIGTGQSSDSLAFGNRNGILDDLCDFAETHPNILLEFKTKSDNVRFFLENSVPENIVCSWSLNPQIIIDNEEHFTASLDNRLKAARAVVDSGIKASFHFHPIIYYDTWREDYTSIAKRVQAEFAPEEVLFISFGSVTFIKPVLQKIRKLGLNTKIHQMQLIPDPHGKMTYPDEIKIDKFSAMYHAFAPWQEKVFFYLCMEKASIWQQALGYVYPDNKAFEKALFESSRAKISNSR